MTADESKSYLGYSNTLVDQHNTYNYSIGKTLADADYSALTK